MNCKYIIQLPSGGDLIIPANFGTIESNSEILSKLESLDREADNFLDEVSGIIREINYYTGGVIDENTLYNLIINNIENPAMIIDSVNNIISNNSEYNNLSKAIKFYLINNPELVINIKDSLSKPIPQSYFKNKSLVGVFNVTNLKSEHLKLQSSISEGRIAGIHSEELLHLDKFINYLRRFNSKDYEENTLFMASNQFGVRSVNIDNLNFFKSGDMDSLFLTMLKRVGSKIDVEILNKVIGKTYKDSSEFFKNTANSEKVSNSDFEKLLNSTDKKDQEKINVLLNEITSLLNGKSDLKNSLKSLLINLNTELYSEEYNNRKAKSELFLKEEQQFNNSYKELQLSKIFDTSLEDLGKYYSENKKLTSNTLYEDIINKVNIGKDLIKLPKPEGGFEFVLISDIFIRERGSQSTGMYVRGIYKTSTGKYETLSNEFKNGETVEYKNREVPKLDYNPNIDVRANDKTITIRDKKLSQDIIKYLIQEGDTINKNLIVAGIYPEYVVVLDKEDFINIPYSKISTFESSKLLEFETHKDTISPIIEDVNLISKGDYFKVNNNTYVVLDVDKDNVTSYELKSNNIASLINISKDKISEIKLGLSENLKESESINVLENSLIQSNESTMSQFTDINKVKTGDYGMSIVDNNPIIFKVSDHNTYRGITHNSVINYNNLKDVIFYTSRDISSKSSLSVIRSNSILIHALMEKDINSDLYQELIYVVPKDVKLNTLILLPNNYANIGYYKNANEGINPEEKDATKTILKLLKQKGIIGDKLYAKKINATSSKYILNTDGYQRIDKFSELPKESKDALNVLRPGTLFSVFTDTSISQNIYRINENKGESVIAQYNIINKNGDIITIEKEFETSKLLASKNNPDEEFHPVGSIAALYIPYGNKNLKTIYEAARDNTGLEQINSIKSINKLILNMEEVFTPLGIKIEQNDEVFADGQRAKIHTNSLGELSIILNTKLGDFSDLIHETLHIYLTLLRVTDLNAYGNLINSVVNEEPNNLIFDKEEQFIKKVVSFSKGKINFLHKDLQTFMNELIPVVNNLVKISTGEDIDIDTENILNNPLEFLNTSLSKLYKINHTENSHSLYNMGLLKAEPMFREWVKNNEINLIC